MTQFGGDLCKVRYFKSFLTFARVSENEILADRAFVKVNLEKNIINRIYLRTSDLRFKNSIERSKDRIERSF